MAKPGHSGYSETSTTAREIVFRFFYYLKPFGTSLGPWGLSDLSDLFPDDQRNFGSIFQIFDTMEEIWQIFEAYHSDPYFVGFFSLPLHIVHT